MGLIKSEAAPTRVIPFSLRDIEQQARAIIARAREQADELLAEAQQEARRLHADARAAGTEEGRRAGHAAGLQAGTAQGNAAALAEQREKLSMLIQSLAQVLAEIDTQRAHLAAEATADVVRLSLAIARKVSRLHGAATPEPLLANVADAVHRVITAADLRIAVHPTQRDTLQAALPNLGMALPKLAHALIVDDASLTPGGCRIYTAGGLIDADLDQQIDHIAAALLAAPVSAAVAAGMAQAAPVSAAES
jgi:flagellar assembly protein FliH